MPGGRTSSKPPSDRRGRARRTHRGGLPLGPRGRPGSPSSRWRSPPRCCCSARRARGGSLSCWRRARPRRVAAHPGQGRLQLSHRRRVGQRSPEPIARGLPRGRPARRRSSRARRGPRDAGVRPDRRRWRSRGCWPASGRPALGGDAATPAAAARRHDPRDDVGRHRAGDVVGAAARAGAVRPGPGGRHPPRPRARRSGPRHSSPSNRRNTTGSSGWSAARPTASSCSTRRGASRSGTRPCSA